MMNLLPAGPSRRRSAVNWKMEQAARMDDRQAGSKRHQRLGQTIQGRNDASCSCVAAISITRPFGFSTSLQMLYETDVRVKCLAGCDGARLQAASR
jgi:hypothetical protein